MSGPQAALLSGGTRLHLQHGPIDLIIGAEGARSRAFQAAHTRFSTVLAELVEELPALRRPVAEGGPDPSGRVARRMVAAVAPFADLGFVTPMAAVAGAVAEEVLGAMTGAAKLTRAYVNNGGDIALHLQQGQVLTAQISGTRREDLGQVRIGAKDPARGIATSGRHGRSHSFGIADSVTVLARSAAVADVAATLIANAVDLPRHPGILRRPASALSEDSDLGDRPVVVSCGPLAPSDRAEALQAGLARAMEFLKTGRIAAASLTLQGDTVATPGPLLAPQHHAQDQDLAHAS